MKFSAVAIFAVIAVVTASPMDNPAFVAGVVGGILTLPIAGVGAPVAWAIVKAYHHGRCLDVGTAEKCNNTEYCEWKVSPESPDENPCHYVETEHKAAYDKQYQNDNYDNNGYTDGQTSTQYGYSAAEDKVSTMPINQAHAKVAAPSAAMN